MKIKVIAPFEIPGLDREDRLEVPEGTRVRDVLKRSPSLHGFLRVLPVMVNGKQVKAAHVLKDGDILVIVVPVSGG